MKLYTDNKGAWAGTQADAKADFWYRLRLGRSSCKQGCFAQTGLTNVRLYPKRT